MVEHGPLYVPSLLLGVVSEVLQNDTTLPARHLLWYGRGWSLLDRDYGECVYGTHYTFLRDCWLMFKCSF